MPIFLDRMPISADSREHVVRGDRVRVRANQIIVWASLSLKRNKEPNPSATPFPVILDTGYNHSFSINERHLNEWAGMTIDTLERRSSMRDRGQRIGLRLANLWIHPNARGKREELADVLPHLLNAESGIAVYPGSDFPRLPILGLRAIAENGLVLNVNGPRREATLRTPMWWSIW